MQTRATMCIASDLMTIQAQEILLSIYGFPVYMKISCYLKGNYIFGAIVFLPLFSTPIAILPSLLFPLHSYPYCFKTKPRFTPSPSTTPNSVKEDNFALVNIPLFFLKLCEYTLICHYIATTFQ